MIDQEYGLNSDLNGITPEFRNNLFSTKEIDLEGKYINIRNLNGILKEILNTLYDYYKGKVLVYIDEQLYPQGSVFEYKGNLYYVLREYTDEEIGFLGYPQDGDIFKLLTPNFTRLIEDVRRAFQNNIDTLDKKYNGLINNLQVEDKNINQRITENTHRFEELLDREIGNYAEMNKQFSMIKQVLIEHGIINNQEDNFISELQNIVKEIISANQRQDTELQAIRDKNDLQDNEFNNLKTDYSSFKANTTRAIENDDLRIKALQDKDNIHENTMNKLRTYHDSLYATITDEVEKAETRIDGKIADACEDTENDIYSEITGAGKEGEFLQIVFNKQSGRSEIQSSPVINFSKIATTQEQVDALKLEPVGMSTVFNTWYRFSHWWADENLDNGVHLDTRNAWSYDPSTKMIKSNRNSPVYSAFVSPRKLSNWYLKLLAYGGGDGDNDAVLINLAYMKGKDGHEHTIDLVRAVMGAGNGVYQDSHGMDYYWSIVYDYRLNTQFELANNTYIQPIAGGWGTKAGGWGTKYCCFSSQRTKTTFKCYTSQIGARTEEVDLKSEISWTLPLSKPSNYSDAMYNNLKIMMENPAQMGVGAHSQNGLFTILDQKYIFDDEKIYDFVSNNIWEYDEPSHLWNSVGKCSDLFDGFVYSRITGDLYYLDNGKVINLNNASSVVNNDELSEKITQLGTEIEQKDTEVLNTVNAHTDEQVQKLQKKIDDLETRLQAVELKVLKV